MKHSYLINGILGFSLIFCSISNVTAKNLIILLDISGSTPIVDGQVQKRQEAILAGEIKNLSLGDKIEIRTVGDERMPIFSMTQVVQRYKTPQGATKDTLANEIPTMINRFIQEALKNNGQYLQGESALTNAVYDANKLCGQDCRALFFTDGFQYTQNGLSYPRDYQKPLPPLPGMDLSTMSIRMLGVGSGLETHPEARVIIEQQWQKWLHDAKVKDVTIERF